MSQNKIKLSHPTGKLSGTIKIGGSKSISNRVLILNALAKGQDKANASKVSNLSDSDDTQTLVALLSAFDNHHGANPIELDAHHAGTTFRFLTAYLAIQDGHQVLTGSDRMKNRPVGPLVTALQELGADIRFIEKEGYPPLSIGPFKKQLTDRLSIRSDISSQFLSALCMIAPCLDQGLSLTFEGAPVSGPYLQMTLDLMKEYGVEVQQEDRGVAIEPQGYSARDFVVESDWSSASYFYAMTAIAHEADLGLEYYKPHSKQADSIISTFEQEFGVRSQLEGHTLRLLKSSNVLTHMQHDFLTHPDIAQTIAVICAAKDIAIDYSGLKTLKIKETDRVAALEAELAKVNVTFGPSQREDVEYSQGGDLRIALPSFETYQDHRMAMCMAPLALLSPIIIEDPSVVNKSYPQFWRDLISLGFVVEEI